MIHNYLLLCLFGISVCFLADTVAREAIISGNLVHNDQYRYMVSVQIDNNGHVCGGCIIKDRFVLTAAQCVLNSTRHLRSKRISVVAGTTNLKRKFFSRRSVTRQVKTVFFPKEFHATIEFKIGDIAVLELEKALPLNDHKDITRAQLSPIMENVTYTNMLGFGWNRYYNGAGSSDGRLRSTLSYIPELEMCEDHFPPGAIQPEVHVCVSPAMRVYTLNVNQSITDAFFGTCTGDEGGPLVQDSKVIGILTRISSNCHGSELTIYTHISLYVNRIEHILEHGTSPRMISLST